MLETAAVAAHCGEPRVVPVEGEGSIRKPSLLAQELSGARIPLFASDEPINVEGANGATVLVRVPLALPLPEIDGRVAYVRCHIVSSAAACRIVQGDSRD